MIDLERPVFGTSEVIEIAGKFETEDEAFLIGGQATNLWAWFYQEKEPELKSRGPFTSEDIDLLRFAGDSASRSRRSGRTIISAQSRRSHR